MTREDVARLLAGIEHYDPRRRFNPLDVATWAELLDDVRFDDAKAAVIAHYKSKPFPIQPADIRTHCEHALAQRIKERRASTLTPPCRSTRCRCDHTACDVGWVTTTRPDHRGIPQEASAKCPACFPLPTASTNDERDDHRKEPA